MLRSLAASVLASLAVTSCGDPGPALDPNADPAPGTTSGGAPGAEDSGAPPAVDPNGGPDALDASKPVADAASHPSDGAAPTPASANPLEPVVGFEDYDLTTACGSCGSHAGAVSFGYFLGDTSVSQVQAIELHVYKSLGLPCRPGASDLVTAYGKYLIEKNLPWKAVLFHDSTAVLGYITRGSPVVAHTKQWGGHYVAIHGLKASASGTMMVHFSDGTINDGLSNTLPTGNLKTWTWSEFLSAAYGDYIGFQHK